MRRTLTVLLLAAGLSAVTLPARAEERSKVQVLSLMSGNAYEQSQAFTIALKRAVTRAEGWSLSKGDFSLEVMVAALGCPDPPDAPCLVKIGKKVGTNRYVWGTMDRVGDEVVTHLRLWEEGENIAETKLRYSANLSDASDDTLLKLAENAFSKLVGVPVGQLSIQAGKVDGEVFVDEELLGTLSAGTGTFDVPAGEHQVRVKAEGYNDAVGTVQVEAGESAELVLNPTSAGDVPGAEEPSGPEEPTNVKKLAGYASVGLGGALIIGGVFSSIKVNSINSDPAFEAYRRSSNSDDICAEAEKGTQPPGAPPASEIADMCSTASTFQTLQYVFYGLGAVATGAGVYLLLSSDEEQVREPRLQPLVGIGPGGGRVDLRVRF